MTDKVRSAVIGAGWWGTMAHIPALLQHPGAELAAVQHRDQETVEKIASDFGIPRGVTSVDELLAGNDLDAVVISSTVNMHYQQAKAALARGLHVLIEKPMTFSAAEARTLVELADKQGVQFLVSGPWHYTEHAAEAQRLIRGGAMGEIKMISVLMTNFGLGFYRGLPWDEAFNGAGSFETAKPPYLKPEQSAGSDPAVCGGGQIYNQVSHVGGHLALLTGQEPVEVFARFDNHGTRVDVSNTLNVKLSSGTLVSIASTGATMGTERNYEVRVYGTEGMLFMELWKGTMQYHARTGEVRPFPDLPEAAIYPMYAPTENLVDVVLGTAPNRSPATLGWSAMKLIEGACESVRTGANVMVTGKS
ncbi:MAG: Gfo/Idh/MocA family oxidoreductase [Lentisphaeria bacterium]|jgi:predicted dehydrogenase|nr:Gfo/Idh/MocA family oxidoreductase [Lentisphaeria bacterium]MDP7742645.1 Gfo/Idh/MocA family oxidoreductase [Lentisphaeria bacterium]